MSTVLSATAHGGGYVVHRAERHDLQRQRQTTQTVAVVVVATTVVLMGWWLDCVVSAFVVTS